MGNICNRPVKLCPRSGREITHGTQRYLTEKALQRSRGSGGHHVLVRQIHLIQLCGTYISW